MLWGKVKAVRSEKPRSRKSVFCYHACSHRDPTKARSLSPFCSQQEQQEKFRIVPQIEDSRTTGGRACYVPGSLGNQTPRPKRSRESGGGGGGLKRAKGHDLLHCRMLSNRTGVRTHPSNLTHLTHLTPTRGPESCRK